VDPKRFLAELKRRKVYSVAVTYAVVVVGGVDSRIAACSFFMHTA
jgi:hypothetical protein